MTFTDPDEDGLVQFLCKEKGFNEERVRAGTFFYWPLRQVKPTSPRSCEDSCCTRKVCPTAFDKLLSSEAFCTFSNEETKRWSQTVWFRLEEAGDEETQEMTIVFT